MHSASKLAFSWFWDWGQLICHRPEQRLIRGSRTDTVLLIKNLRDASSLRSAPLSPAQRLVQCSHVTGTELPKGGKSTDQECFAQKTTGFLLPLLLNSSLLSCKTKDFCFQKLHIAFFLSDSISQYSSLSWSFKEDGTYLWVSLILRWTEISKSWSERKSSSGLIAIGPWLVLTAQRLPTALLFE